jgi:hypothetical protein
VENIYLWFMNISEETEKVYLPNKDGQKQELMIIPWLE